MTLLLGVSKTLEKWTHTAIEMLKPGSTVNESNCIVGMQDVAKIGQGINAALRAACADNAIMVPVYGPGETEELSMEESIASLKRSLKGMKFDWKNKDKYATILGFADGYVPLSTEPVGHPDAIFGAVRLRHTGTGEGGFSSSVVCGLRVSAKQSTHQTRGWEAFHVLTNLVSARTLNVFPVPLSASIEASGSVLFAFDFPERCRSLGSLMGVAGSSSIRSNDVFAPGALATYLRKHPAVVSTWCMQLGATYRAITRAQAAGLFAVPIDINKDVYVKDNGMLLVGNCSFCGSSTESTQTDMSAHSVFTDFVRAVLESALCLSRKETAVLLPQGSLNMDSDDEGDEPTGAGAGKRRSVMGRSTLAISAGSNLDVLPVGVSFKAVNVEHSHSPLAGQDAEGHENNVLYVHVVGDPHVADVQVLHGPESPDKPSMYLRVAGATAGVITVSMRVRDRESGVVSVSKLHVKVLPPLALASVDVAEMIDLLQSSDAGSPGGQLFLRAQAMRKVSYDEVSVSKVWDDIVEDLVPFKQ